LVGGGATAAVVTGGVGADVVGCFGEAEAVADACTGTCCVEAAVVACVEVAAVAAMAATPAARVGDGDGDGDGDWDGGGDASGDELHGRSVLKGRARAGVGGGAKEAVAVEVGAVAAAHGGSHCVASVCT
jgi:hypothetical protein